MEEQTRVSGLFVCGTALLVCALCLANPVSAAVESPEAARCASVTAGSPILFEGHTLLEAPDITEPDLRRANALLTERCAEQALQLLQDYAVRDPDNYHVLFLKARSRWHMGNRSGAQMIIETVLRAHPDFSSAKTLLASMYVDDQDFPTADKLLKEVEKTQPDDLWLFIDRLRMEANLAPSTSTAKTVAAIQRDPRFPSSVRAQALHISQYEMTNLSQDQRDNAFNSAMDSGGGITDCALALKAREIIELRNEPRQGAQLIERYLGKSTPCEATPMVRELLAEAYLLQAAKIAPTPVPANATLAKRARDVLDGDLTPVALHVAIDPSLDPLIPFFKGFVDPNAVDQYGQTALCGAVRAFNPPMVKQALAEHADPNGSCRRDGQESILRSILLMATQEHVAARQEIVRELLTRGARVEGMEGCAKPENGDCYIVLLPILQEFATRRAQTRESL